MAMQREPYPLEYRQQLPNGTSLLTTLGRGNGRMLLRATLLGTSGAPCGHFGYHGSVLLDIGAAPSTPTARASPPRLISRHDGEFSYIGLSHPRAQWQALLLRLDARGRLDIGWGYREFQVPGQHTLLHDFALLRDGRVLACGVRWNIRDGIRQGFLARLERNGRLDPSYGDGGFARLRGTRQDSGFTCLGPAQAQGDRWLLGFCASGSDSQLLTVTALDDEGLPQPGYAGVLPVACQALQADAIQQCAGGHGLITGTATQQSRPRAFAAGLLPNGRFDGSFGNGAALEWRGAGQRLACL